MRPVYVFNISDMVLEMVKDYNAIMCQGYND